jgi:hypothetical protein
MTQHEQDQTSTTEGQSNTLSPRDMLKLWGVGLGLLLLAPVLSSCKKLEEFSQVKTESDGLTFDQTDVFNLKESFLYHPGVEVTPFGQNDNGRIISLSPKAFRDETYYPRRVPSYDTYGEGKELLKQLEKAHKEVEKVFFVQTKDAFGTFQTIDLPVSQGVLDTLNRALDALHLKHADLTTQQRGELAKILFSEDASAANQFPLNDRVTALGLSLINSPILRGAIPENDWIDRASIAGMILSELPTNIKLPDDLPIEVYADILTLANLPDNPTFSPESRIVLQDFARRSGDLGHAVFVPKFDKEFQAVKQAFIERHEPIPPLNMQVVAVVREDTSNPEFTANFETVYPKMVDFYARYQDKDGQLPSDNSLFDHNSPIGTIPLENLQDQIGITLRDAKDYLDIDEALSFFGVDKRGELIGSKGPVEQVYTVLPEDLQLIAIPNNGLGLYKERFAWGYRLNHNSSKRVLIVNPMLRDQIAGIDNMIVDANTAYTEITNAHQLVAAGHHTLDNWGALTPYETYLLSIKGLSYPNLDHGPVIPTDPAILRMFYDVMLGAVETDANISQWNMAIATKPTQIKFLDQRQLGLILDMLNKVDDKWDTNLITNSYATPTDTGMVLAQGEAISISAVMQIDGHYYGIIGPKITREAFDTTQTGPEKFLASLYDALILEQSHCHLIDLQDEAGNISNVITLDADNQLYKTFTVVVWSAAIAAALLFPEAAGAAVAIPGLLLRKYALHLMTGLAL